MNLPIRVQERQSFFVDLTSGVEDGAPAEELGMGTIWSLDRGGGSGGCERLWSHSIDVAFR